MALDEEPGAQLRANAHSRFCALNAISHDYSESSVSTIESHAASTFATGSELFCLEETHHRVRRVAMSIRNRTLQLDPTRKLKAVFLDMDWLGPAASLEELKGLPIEWEFYPSTSPADLIARLQHAEIAVTKQMPFTREMFAQCQRLRLLCIASANVDQIDLDAAKEARVVVCNAPGYSTRSVAQHTMLLLLSISANFSETKREPTAPYFYGYPIRELYGKELGIVGFGRVGQEVAKLAFAFGMKIRIAEHSDRSRSVYHAIPLRDLLKTVDYLTIHVPFKAETENLITKTEMELMKRSACLINTSHGGIVNEADLAEALKEQWIAGAALDVLSQEPPAPNHILLDPSVPNLILTPHIGWASKESRERLIEIVEGNIRAFLAGSLRNVVTKRPCTNEFFRVCE